MQTTENANHLPVMSAFLRECLFLSMLKISLSKFRARRTLREIDVLILFTRHRRPGEAMRLGECLAVSLRQRRRGQGAGGGGARVPDGLAKMPGAPSRADFDLHICSWASFNQSANNRSMNMYFMLNSNRQEHNILSQEIPSLVLDD